MNTRPDTITPLQVTQPLAAVRFPHKRRQTATPAAVAPGWSAIADRDSVCAGDDAQSHERMFTVPLQASVPDMVHRAIEACGLASIAGGQATWIVEAGGIGGQPVAVVAQQWAAVRFLAAGAGEAASLFHGGEPRLFFRYWCQADPQAVFDALSSGAPLPPRHGAA